MHRTFIALLLVSCADTNDLEIELAPDVVSSLDGTLEVRAAAFADDEPAEGSKISIAVEYVDRNGASHAIDPVDGTTMADGTFTAMISGLTWDGTGTVTATLGQLTAATTFAVLDRTPPKVSIASPTASMHVVRGADVTIEVHVTDEIGVSQVFFETQGQNNFNNRQRSTVVASGTTDANVPFDFTVSDNATVGSTITIYALAADLSGNQAAAQPITLTVDGAP